ncbi:MAG: hypothetical protein ACOYYS_06130 [Chloroflexota bacterium]
MKLIGDQPYQNPTTALPKRPTRNASIRICWPSTAIIGVIGGQWRRLADGRIEASYTPDELASVLFIAGYDVTGEQIRCEVIERKQPMTPNPKGTNP